MSQFSGQNREDSKRQTASIRLLIADDQPRVRQSLEAQLTALRCHVIPPVRIDGQV